MEWSEAGTGIWRAEPPGVHARHGSSEVVCCNAQEMLATMNDAVADLVFLDPPFNLGKRYGRQTSRADQLGEGEYERFLGSILREAQRIMKPGAALFLYHLPRWALQFGADLAKKLSLRHWIAVAMKNGFPKGGGLYPAHYALLYLTKGEPATFTRPKIKPLICRHCGGFVRDYGGYEKFVIDGVNLSDVWDDLSPVRHPARKHRRANELPYELLRRVVEIAGFPGGVFVDPFVGGGTSAVAAVEAGMRCIVGDLDPASCRITGERLAKIKPTIAVREP
jgi:site-specific DNA-methyltransferase (adenine-specific)